MVISFCLTGQRLFKRSGANSDTVSETSSVGQPEETTTTMSDSMEPLTPHAADDILPDPTTQASPEQPEPAAVEEEEEAEPGSTETELSQR